MNNHLYVSVGLCVGTTEPEGQLAKTLKAFEGLASAYAMGEGEWYENGELIHERNVHFRMIKQTIAPLHRLCNALEQYRIGFTYLCDGESVTEPVYWHSIDAAGQAKFDTYHGLINTGWEDLRRNLKTRVRKAGEQK